MNGYHDEPVTGVEAHRWRGRAALPVQRAPPTSQPPGCRPDVAIEDWDDLLSRVKARLRRTVGGSLCVPAESTPLEAAARFQAGVHECVAALDQLHATLKHEFARHHGVPPTLSALPDHASIRARLPAALATAGSGAVLLVELDDFAAINRAHGHAVGDDLFQIVAARLVRAVRHGDSVSARGANGFAVLLERVSSGARLSPLACRLFDAISAPLALGDVRIALRPNLGIASFPTDGRSFDELLANAEAAMQRAKRSQYGYAFFDRFADG